LVTKELLQGFYIRCRGALLALLDIEAYPLAFGQCPKTLHGDGGMVDKYILFLTIDLDKAESLALIEPLYASFCHSRILLLKYFSSWDTTKKKASGLEASMPCTFDFSTNFDRQLIPQGQLAVLISLRYAFIIHLSSFFIVR
jgi:hypothetical protein